jgi:hypothetical protein
MHLQIVLTLGNSLATECVSLIAERTREEKDKTQPAVCMGVNFP